MSLATVLLATVLVGTTAIGAVHAQDGTVPPPGPPAGGATKPVKTIKFTLIFKRPGSYLCYPIQDGRKGEGISIQPGQSTLPVEVSTDIQGIEVLDEVSGLIATLPLGKIKPNSKVPIRPEEFNQIQGVIVELKSKNGEPAAKGVIRLTPNKSEPIQYGLSTMDGGSVRFENIPLGRAEVTAYGNTGDDTIKQSVIIAPTIGGKPQVITLTLPLDVQTVKPSPTPVPNPSPGTTVIINNGEEKRESKNDWVSGIIGLAVLGGGGFFGYRYLKQRGLTPKEAIADAMVQLGVDSPGAVVPGSHHSGLRPSTPDVVQTPLPSLTDLPTAGVAAGPVSMAPVKAFAGPHLVGLSGPVAGQIIALVSDTESMLTVGRDPLSGIPLPNDSAVSRRHAVFMANGQGWDLMDEASTNGTYLNGKRVENRTALMSGDEVQIGMARFRFEA